MAPAFSEKPVLGLQVLPDAFESSRFWAPLKSQFWVWRFESYVSRLSFWCWIQKALCWETEVKGKKSTTIFRKNWEFRVFETPLGFCKYLREGRFLKVEEVIFVITMTWSIEWYKKKRKKIFHCKLALCASYKNIFSRKSLIINQLLLENFYSFLASFFDAQ